MQKSIKLAIVGLSKVGKTSIYKRCFEDQKLEEIQNIPPTIGISQNAVNLKHIHKGINIWDFGGQETFRESYLQNPDYFIGTEIIIFVVDITAPKDLPETKKYFNSIIKIFEKKELPRIFVFLHKGDPEKRKQLNDNIAKFLIELNSIFGNDVSFYVTSIYDDSACKALNQILFLSLPDEILSKLFSSDIFNEIKKIVVNKFKNEPLERIDEISQIIGLLLRRKLYDLWLQNPLKKVEKSEKKAKFPLIIQNIIKNNKEYFKLSCPKSKDRKNCSEIDCIIGKGLIEGILNSMNLKHDEIQQNKEKNECFFSF